MHSVCVCAKMWRRNGESRRVRTDCRLLHTKSMPSGPTGRRSVACAEKNTGKTDWCVSGRFEDRRDVYAPWDLACDAQRWALRAQLL